jgi:hypothetical protein
VAAAVAVAVGVGLYFGLLHTQPSGPPQAVTIQFVPSSSSAEGSTFFDNFSLQVSANLSTPDVGFELVGATGNTLAAGSAIDHCTGPMVSSCTGSNLGWYVGLTSSSGRILALYDAELWTGTVAVQTGDHVVLVANYPLAGSSSHFLAVATGNLSVSGSILL